MNDSLRVKVRHSGNKLSKQSRGVSFFEVTMRQDMIEEFSSCVHTYEQSVFQLLKKEKVKRKRKTNLKRTPKRFQYIFPSQ